MKKTILNITKIIIYCLIFYIFNAPSAMKFFVIAELSVLKVLIMNFCGYIVLFMICHGTDKNNIKKALIAFGITLPFKFVTDLFADYLSDAVVLRDWANDLIFLIITLVISISILAVYKINPFKKEKTVYFILIIAGMAVIISSGFIVADAVKTIDYKHQFHSDSKYLQNAAYLTLNISETYRIGMIAARAILLAGAAGLCKKGNEEHTRLKLITCVFLILYLIFNLLFNTANAVSGIGSTYTIADKYKGELSKDYQVFNIYRGKSDLRYICFTQVKNYVYLGNEQICTYYTEPLAACGWNIDFADYNYQSIVCQLDKILYLKNGKWRTIHFTELNRVKEDKKLTEIIRNICDTGSAEALKYCAPYLKKYDSEYLYELVENFDERQTDVSCNEILTKQYISDILNGILDDR
ncbi:MAG: hypothetical protein IJZ72_01255 [Oscillospiraceae bacterium]|nr:hypothetical protein [Oscillospiraceae bacterium]